MSPTAQSERKPRAARSNDADNQETAAKPTLKIIKPTQATPSHAGIDVESSNLAGAREKPPVRQ